MPCSQCGCNCQGFGRQIAIRAIAGIVATVIAGIILAIII